jgi:hypothetical protein
LALVAIAAVAAAAVWYFAVRPKPSAAPATWDPRVATLAGYVQHQQGLAWKRPLRVTYLSAPVFAQRLGTDLATARPKSAPFGTNTARYQPADRTLYVNAGRADVYSEVAVVGQLAEALHDQYVGGTSPAAAELDAARAQAAFAHTLSRAQAAVLHQEEIRGS